MTQIANLVHETSTTTGTGDLTLANVNGKQPFNTAFGNGSTADVFHYFISNRSAAEWERGTGHLSAASTLVRDTVSEGTNGTSAVNFSAGTKDVTSDQPAQFRRELLTADRTYYVRTDGSDSHDGLTNSAAGAWLTLIHAWKTICSTLDLCGFNVTIDIGSGTYANGVTTYGDVSGPPDDSFTHGYVPVGGGTITFQSHTGTASDVIVQNGSGSDGICFEVEHAFQTLTTWQNVTFDAQGSVTSFANPAWIVAPCNVQFSGCSFINGSGSIDAIHVQGPEVSCNVFGATIDGNWNSFISVQQQAIGQLFFTITLTGTPAWGTAFAIVETESVLSSFAAFSGSSTGRRFSVKYNSSIKTNGGSLTTLPGDTAGTLIASVYDTLSRLVLPVSGGASLASTDSSENWISNEGAGSLATFNLPSADASLFFSFIVEDSDGIKIVANSGDTINIGGSVSAAAGYAQSTLVGSTLTLIAVNATEWIATSALGTWSVV